MDNAEQVYEAIMEVLRDHPRDSETIAWGVQVEFDIEISIAAVNVWMGMLVKRGFIRKATCGSKKWPMWVLTDLGLKTQADIRESFWEGPDIPDEPSGNLAHVAV